jgi:hypothetical protein
MENIEVFTDSGSGIYLVDHDKQIAIANVQFHDLDAVKDIYVNDNDDLLAHVISEEEYLEKIFSTESLHFINYDKFMDEVNSGDIDCPEKYKYTHYFGYDTFDINQEFPLYKIELHNNKYVVTGMMTSAADEYDVSEHDTLNDAMNHVKSELLDFANILIEEANAIITDKWNANHSCG